MGLRLLCRDNKIAVVSDGLSYRFDKKALILSLIFIFLVLFVENITAYFYNQTLADGKINSLTEIVSSAVLAPIWEEIVFRGFLIGFMMYALREKLGHIKANDLIIISLIIVCSSIPFTFIHLSYTGEYQIVTVFIKSLCYGCAYVMSGRNLLPPTIIHSVSNLFLMLM